VEAVILVGLQGAGKSTFYRERFFDTHIRVNLDMLRTRHRERLLLEACLRMTQPFVVDNTNATVAQRARYIERAREARFDVVGYFFVPDVPGSVARNLARDPNRHVPPAGLYGTLKRLEPPTHGEGFARLYRVRVAEGGKFEVEEQPPITNEE
jgi:predicted kinase